MERIVIKAPEGLKNSVLEDVLSVIKTIMPETDIEITTTPLGHLQIIHEDDESLHYIIFSKKRIDHNLIARTLGMIKFFSGEKSGKKVIAEKVAIKTNL